MCKVDARFDFPLSPSFGREKASERRVCAGQLVIEPKAAADGRRETQRISDEPGSIGKVPSGPYIVFLNRGFRRAQQMSRFHHDQLLQRLTDTLSVCAVGVTELAVGLKYAQFTLPGVGQQIVRKEIFSPPLDGRASLC